MRNRVLGPIFSVAFTAALLASLGSGVAPSATASNPAVAEVQADQFSLSVEDSRVCLNQLGPKGGRADIWLAELVAYVKISGAKPYQDAELRIQAPAWNIDYTSPAPVGANGVAGIGASDPGKFRSSLAAAKQDAQLPVGTATIQARLVPDGDPLSVQVNRWPITQSVKLASVKMRRTGNNVTFTGRLLSEDGRPVPTGYAVVYEIRETSAVGVGNTGYTDAKGNFKVTASSPKQRGKSIAISVRAYGTWCSTIWSRAFAS